MDYTIKLLKEGEKCIKLDDHRETVLVLGNTGSGKTTFIQFLAGNNDDLISKEVAEGEFIIEDTNGKISQKTTIISKTIFPEHVVDTETNTLFYDCPGFSDTRNSSIDIAAAYFIRRVIDSAKSVKLIFLINYPSVRHGVDRTDFLTLVKHATALIKNLDKFKNSIALVTTKVDNSYSFRKNEFKLISDDVIINNIADFIQNAKETMESAKRDGTNDEVYNDQSIQFLNILLDKQEGNFTKLFIFRRPNEPGKLSNIEVIQTAKQSIMTKLIENIKFSEKEDSDFDYTISPESKNNIINWIETININITNSISNITQMIFNHYQNQSNNFIDIYSLAENSLTAHNSFIKITNSTNEISTPKCLVENIKKSLDLFNISYPKNTFVNILVLEDHMKLLQIVNKNKINSRPLDWIKPLDNAVQFLNELNNLYTFLIVVYIRLSEYDIQKNANKFDVNDLNQQIEIWRKNNTNIKGSYLKSYMDKIFMTRNDRNSYDKIQDVYFNSDTLKMLNDIVSVTTSKFQMDCSKPNELEVKGRYVVLSLMLSKLKVCSSKLKSMVVFALDKVFIDSDIINIGDEFEVSIISPVWEVIGERKINLNGEKGQDHYSRARDGTYYNRHGHTGAQGRNGGNGGNFFGYGFRYINGKNLLISANGGDGGRGQNGGNGEVGENGESPYYYNLHMFYREYLGESKDIFIFYNRVYDEYRIYGSRGGRGGNGGDGGKGGFPGAGGKVTIIEAGGESAIKNTSSIGSGGYGGLGGKGGKGGRYGNVCRGRKKSSYVLFIPTGDSWDSLSCYPSDEFAAYGNNGVNGFSSSLSYLNPNKFDKIQHYPSIVNRYKDYFTKNLNMLINDYVITQFKSHLNYSKNLRKKRAVHSVLNNNDLINQQRVSLINTFKLDPNLDVTSDTQNIKLMEGISSIPSDGPLKSGSSSLRSPINTLFEWCQNLFQPNTVNPLHISSNSEDTFTVSPQLSDSRQESHLIEYSSLKNNTSLLLADLLIRKYLTQEKYKSEYIVNLHEPSSIAHNLVYNYYCNKQKKMENIFNNTSLQKILQKC